MKKTNKQIKGDIYELDIDFRTHRIINEVLKWMKVDVPRFSNVQLHQIADIREEVIKDWPGYGRRSHKRLKEELKRVGIELK